MNMTNDDKAAILNGGAKVFSTVTVVGTNFIFTEDDYISNWTYEDFRYVPDTGFLGEFVEKLFDCELLGVPLNCDLENATVNLKLGVMATPGAPIHYYDYGNFIVTKVTYSDTDDKTKIECADYAKLFNGTFTNNDDFYPCIAMQLSNKICEDVNVYPASDGMSYIYIVKEDEELPIGTYAILVDGTYYEFTTTAILKPNDIIMLNFINNVAEVVQKHIVYDANMVPSVVRTTLIHTTDSTTTSNVLQTESTPHVNFTNNDFVIFGNPFDDGVTNREVIQNIAKLAYSWARINEENKLTYDFTVGDTDNVDEYNEISIDNYTTSTIDGDTVSPVNKVLLGLKDIDGENVYRTSQDYTPETESTIYIYDNPITYDVEKRLLALDGCERLFGMTYTPVTIESMGHPWLNGDDLIELTNLDETVVYAYPFNRTHTYAGYIVSTLQSITGSSAGQTHEYKDDTGAKLRQTQYVVDKMNGEIRQTIERQDNDHRQLLETVASVDKINNIFQLQGGNNLIKNSAFLLTDKVWEFEELVEDLGEHTELGKSYTTNYLGTVISNAEIKLKNTKMVSKPELNNISITQLNNAHTFSFKYKMDDFTEATVKLINPSDNSVIFETELEPTDDITEVVGENIIPRYSNVLLQIETTTTNAGYLYLYDLLLNIGEKQTWSPASDEIVSTVIRLSQLGVTILARGSDFATVMSSDEFAVYKATFNGEEVTLGERVSKFDGSGIETTDIKSKSVATGKYVMEDRNWGGVEHHIEYFKDN